MHLELAKGPGQPLSSDGQSSARRESEVLAKDSSKNG